MLRCSLSVSHPSLEKCDALLKQAIKRIINSDLSDHQWIQASLPVIILVCRDEHCPTSVLELTATCCVKLQLSLLSNPDLKLIRFM